MKRLIFTLIALAAFTAAHAEHHTINVGEFNELVVNDNINVVYSEQKDSLGMVAFDLEKRYASMVMADRNKGKLKLQLDAEAATVLKEKPTVYVYSSYLSKAVNNNDSTLTLRTVAPGAKVDIQLKGNGKILAYGIDAVNLSLKIITGRGTIIATGRCDNLTVVNLGTGIVQADEVAAKNAKCSLMGTGTIGCAPTETLNVKGLGTGKVYYSGSPVISKVKLSTVKVIRLDDSADVAAPEVTETEETTAPTEEEAEEDTTQTDENTSLLNMMEVPSTLSTPSATRKPVK